MFRLYVPSYQPVAISHLLHDLDEFRGLEFADYEGSSSNLAVGVSFGIDFYRNLITGTTLRSKAGPVACSSKLRYILGGRIGSNITQSHCFETHLLRFCVETDIEPNGLRQNLQKFWNVEETSSPNDCVVNQFQKDITHDM